MSLHAPPDAWTHGSLVLGSLLTRNPKSPAMSRARFYGIIKRGGISGTWSILWSNGAFAGNVDGTVLRTCVQNGTVKVLIR